MKSKAMKLKQTIFTINRVVEKLRNKCVLPARGAGKTTPSIVFFNSFILLLFFGSFSGFMFLSPTGVKWKDKLYDRFPQVKLKMNPNFGGNLTQDAVLNSAKEASNAWSSGKTKARLFLSFVGQTSSSPVGLDTNLCTNPNRETTKNLDNIIYAQSSEDPDCTGVACSFVWYCNGTVGEEEIVHFDIQVNTRDYSFETGIAAPEAYNLKTVLLKQLGYVIGFFTCPPGNMSCPVTGNGITPDENSALYKFLKPEVHKTSISSDDALGVRTLYGELTNEELEKSNVVQGFALEVDSLCNPYPCQVLNEETDSRYAIRPQEIAALQVHENRMQAAGMNTVPARLNKFQWIQKDYLTALIQNPLSAEDYLKENLDNSRIYISETPKELLLPSVLDLCVTIHNRKRAMEEHKYELDAQYLEFLEVEMKTLIILRRRMLDEISTRI